MQLTGCGSLYTNTIVQAMSLPPSNLPTSILAIGSFLAGTPARTSLEGWVRGAGYDTSIINYVTTAAGVKSANFAASRLLYIPSAVHHTPGGIPRALVRPAGV